MINFNNDWDEPDVWSTPAHSPLSTHKNNESEEPRNMETNLNWPHSNSNLTISETKNVLFNSVEFHQNSNQVEEEDEFGEFGEIDHHPFVDFNLKISPILPFTLPHHINKKSLNDSLKLPLESLFSSPPSSSSSHLIDTPISIKRNENENNNNETIKIPKILKKSNEMTKTIKKLIQNGNELGKLIEWKRSQIRRLHLIHLGIPIDLNDFLKPPSNQINKKSLSIDTRFFNNEKSITQSPTHYNLKIPILDRKKCEELIEIKRDVLLEQDNIKLSSIYDELKLLNAQAKETLKVKQNQRDRSIQDCQAYNKMISDLVLAAQKIQMASPGSTKRASSINLGSSSISNSINKKIPLTRNNSLRNTTNNSQVSNSNPETD